MNNHSKLLVVFLVFCAIPRLDAAAQQDGSSEHELDAIEFVPGRVPNLTALFKGLEEEVELLEMGELSPKSLARARDITARLAVVKGRYDAITQEQSAQDQEGKDPNDQRQQASSSSWVPSCLGGSRLRKGQQRSLSESLVQSCTRARLRQDAQDPFSRPRSQSMEVGKKGAYFDGEPLFLVDLDDDNFPT